MGGKAEYGGGKYKALEGGEHVQVQVKVPWQAMDRA
jgi:hypothetical protein